MIRIGTCGFCLRQADYFRTFRLIELQQTFYNPPQLKTAERWRRDAPEGFEFTLKAFQAITHHPASPTFRRAKLSAAERAECGSFRDTPTVRRAWETTLALAKALQSRFVVFQMPARFAPTDENLANMRRFFGWAERGSLTLGWEPRRKDWPAETIADLCGELGLVHVVDPFHDPHVCGAPRYYRLHGLGIDDYRYDYKYRFTDEDLRKLAAMCAGPETYVMFNNIPMCDDAQRFQRLLDAERGAGL